MPPEQAVAMHEAVKVGGGWGVGAWGDGRAYSSCPLLGGPPLLILALNSRLPPFLFHAAFLSPCPRLPACPPPWSCSRGSSTASARWGGHGVEVTRVASRSVGGSGRSEWVSAYLPCQPSYIPRTLAARSTNARLSTRGFRPRLTSPIACA